MASIDESGKMRWLLAGQQLLRTGGIRSVKIDALVAETGLTTGSFYHHFANVAAFRVELAEFYGSVQVGATLATLDDEAPVERIRRLVRIARDELHPLDADA
ncbi:MAG: TetR/AcrR family transcriptional regulator [Ilumatobacteraceae bacterium]